MSEVVAKIDKDYLFDGEGDISSRVGTQWTKEEVESHFVPDTKLEIHPDNRTRFRVLDDDREVYYGGWLLNDDECLVQQVVVQWSTHDAGAIHIEVMNENDEWEMEIG